MASRLVEQLKADFGPVRRSLPVGRALGVWLALAWGLGISATLLTGPLRPGFATQLETSSRFAIECLVGLAAVAICARAALLLAVPGAASPARALGPATAVLALWVLAHLVGTVEPALPPSMLGKREHCFLEVLGFSLPPLAILVFLLRRRAVLHPARTAALAGAAAAAIPAVLMQIACMYDPWHTLVYHLGPLLLIGVAAAGLSSRLLPPRL